MKISIYRNWSDGPGTEFYKDHIVVEIIWGGEECGVRTSMSLGCAIPMYRDFIDGETLKAIEESDISHPVWFTKKEE